MPGSVWLDTDLLMNASGLPSAGGYRKTETEVALGYEPGPFPGGFIRVLPPNPHAHLGHWLEEVGDRLIPNAAPPVPN